MVTRSVVLSLVGLLVACGSSQRVEPVAAKDTDAVPTPPAGTAPASAVEPADAAPPETSVSPEADAGAPDAGPAASEEPVDPPKVKIVTIGMHVGGGPYDEKTKEPFKKAVEPHFPEIARCWAKHVPNPPKQADVGVDLLIEGSGGRPKVSNPRSTLGKGPDVAEFVPCVVAVFESVEFPKLDRGRTGVSYSLRFTAK